MNFTDEKDYIMRMIKEMVRVLFSLAFGKEYVSVELEIIEVALLYQYLSEKDNKFLENNNYTKEEVLSGFKQLLMKSGYSDLLYLLK